MKPPQLSCGYGIKIINDILDVPQTDGLDYISLAPGTKAPVICVQRYIKNPLLINNLKLDLRVYVLVTSVEPFRIYLYDEGLARQVLSGTKLRKSMLFFSRFATEEYTKDPEQISNPFIHLTNYSVNKQSEKFIHSSNPHTAQVGGQLLASQGLLRVFLQGSKWTLASLWTRLREMGIDTELIWDKSKAIFPVSLKYFLISVKDQVVKIFLSAHGSLLEGFREQVRQFVPKP